MCVCVLVCEWIGQREALTRDEAAVCRNSKEDAPPPPSPGDDVLGALWKIKTSPLGQSPDPSGPSPRVQPSASPSFPSAISLFSQSPQIVTLQLQMRSHLTTRHIRNRTRSLISFLVCVVTTFRLEAHLPKFLFLRTAEDLGAGVATQMWLIRYVIKHHTSINIS